MTDVSHIAFASVRDLGAAYRSGRLGPVDVVTASLARLDLLEPKLNAFLEPMREEALRAADEAMRALQAGEDRGPLHGIPVAIKDIIDVAGVPTTYATRAVAPVMPERDAELVRNLRAAGAIILGKTNLLEFAYGIAHPEIGQTNNPFDPGRTSGGSSGGSAAAVAAGIVPLAVGTDTGGSIRIPASYCGIVGLKPTYGLVSTDGVFPLSWSLDHAGPLARSVEDAALLLAGMAGRPMPLARREIGGLRIGFVGAHLDSAALTLPVRALMQEAMVKLSAAGAAVGRIEIAGSRDANPGLHGVLLPEASLVHETLAGVRPEGYAARTRGQLAAGRNVPAIEYLRAQRLRERLRSAVEALFAEVDAIASPAVGFVAPHEDPVITGDEEDGEMISSGLANMTGHPAISIPCGLSEGLPVGLQLVGPMNRDADLLSMAAAIERVLAFGARPSL
ncbi:aspartyl-tRNA(Asn)/glutamyl-tRNA(Gln) amidotransferase subunit A [Faunimonas pinastri]|uniref:Indoleacetamide hydrolase n=1 Tax=Faunimonas pinastri TaxID=1855383 RepID=A0A1H9IBD9_9HYPH|nr:amidase [Faunimonas pinastri]SEQ72041.1 aspartyl-tRNA(Asn)/glutamyl-tRNA(Gln) amidotransferase subunit A [Faunimonas pinastri]